MAQTKIKTMTIKEAEKVMHTVNNIMAVCNVSKGNTIYLATTKAELKAALKCLKKAGEKTIEACIVANVLYIGE